MAMKIKLFLLECNNANPDFIRQVDAANVKRCVFLRIRLEEFGMVDWPFNFWDVEAKCKMKDKLEGTTTVDPEVYIIPCLFEDGAPRKCQCIGDVSVVFDLLDPVAGFDIEVPEFVDLPSNGEPLLERHDSSRRNAIDSEEQSLKSTLIFKEVMQ